MNLPNRLTVLRLLLVPFFILVYLFPYENVGIVLKDYHILFTTMNMADIVGFIIFVVASLTDFFDGRIARSRNLVTTFGKFVDPVADKMLVNSALILLTLSGKMPSILLIIMILRDTLVDSIRFLAASNNVVIAASIWGKAKTMTQMIAICFMLLNNPIFSYFNIPFDLIMMYIATAFSVFSGYDYFKNSKSFIFESM